MGKTCEPKAFSFQCITEFTTNKKKTQKTLLIPPKNKKNKIKNVFNSSANKTSIPENQYC